MATTAEIELLAHKRSMLIERLAQLTSPQRAFFWRIHQHAPYRAGVGEIEKIPERKLMESIDLCDRTLLKNSRLPKCAECEGSGESGHVHTDGTQYSTADPPCHVCKGSGRSSDSAGQKS